MCGAHKKQHKGYRAIQCSHSILRPANAMPCLRAPPALRTDDPTVPPGSKTPTFAAVTLFVDNDRCGGLCYVACVQALHCLSASARTGIVVKRFYTVVVCCRLTALGP